MQALARVVLCMAALQLLFMLPGQAYARSSQPEPVQDEATAMSTPQLPLTVNGRKYHACLVHLAEMVQRSNTSSGTNDRAAINKPMYSPGARQLAEGVVAYMPDNFADNFCAEINAPQLEASLVDLLSGHETHRAAARKAIARAALRRPNPAVSGSPSGNQQTHASTTGGPVQALFDDYQTDPTSNLTLPHTAPYTLRTERSDDDEMFAALISCTTIDIASKITGTLCSLGATDGTWQGVGGGAWQAPGEVLCAVGLAAIQVGYDACYNVLSFNGLYDDTVNGAELEATYENVRKAMDNQVNLWEKVHYTHVLLSQQMARFEQDMNDDFTVLTTQNCDLKTRLADLQREANYLRYLLTTPVEDRPSFSRSAGRCSF